MNLKSFSISLLLIFWASFSNYGQPNEKGIKNTKILNVTKSKHRADLGNVHVINMHTHPLYTLGDTLSIEALDKELKLRITAMDESGISKSVLLSMGFETNISPNLSQAGSERESFYFLKSAPERFVVYTTVDFSQMNSPDFTAKAIEHLVNTVRAGARGLKFELGKPGMHWMPMDDPRLDPIYDKAAELGIPVMYHSNDPEDFFLPVNQFNFWLGKKVNTGTDQGNSERQEKSVSREQLIRECENMLHKHPNSTFILAHFGFLSRRLPLLADIMERYPNVYLEVACALEELGRSPKESVAFMTLYSNRIMFGTDGGIKPQTQTWWKTFLDRHFAILETDLDDLPAPYTRSWNIHGLNLPKDILERIYYKNAEELLARPVNLPPAK
jgi:uncharacterized protein